jgi:hypothetical protein
MTLLSQIASHRGQLRGRSLAVTGRQKQGGFFADPPLVLSYEKHDINSCKYERFLM